MRKKTRKIVGYLFVNILASKIDSVLMKNLSKYVNIINQFGIDISSLRALNSAEEIDDFLISEMQKHSIVFLEKLKLVSDCFSILLFRICKS